MDEAERKWKTERRGGNYGAGTKEMQARNYVARKEQERKRREMFDDALDKFKAGDIPVRAARAAGVGSRGQGSGGAGAQAVEDPRVLTGRVEDRERRRRRRGCALECSCAAADVHSLAPASALPSVAPGRAGGL